MSGVRAFGLALLALAGSVSLVCAETIDMLVPLRVVQPGETLSESDFFAKPFIVTAAGARKYVTSKQQLTNIEAARTLAAGKPVALMHLRSATTVRKGQQASGAYVSGGIAIRAQFIVLDDGHVGAKVKARHVATGRVLLARVLADGTLEVVPK
jgi:flagellar basal body P-ring formation protein FlgA